MDVSTVKTATGYLFGTMLGAIGIRSMLDQVNHSQDFGIPATTPQTRGYVVAMGGRSLAIGLAISSLMYQGDRRAAGVLLVTCASIAVADAFATYKVAGELKGSSWQHIIGGSLYVAAGAWLMG